MLRISQHACNVLFKSRQLFLLNQSTEHCPGKMCCSNYKCCILLPTERAGEYSLNRNLRKVPLVVEHPAAFKGEGVRAFIKFLVNSYRRFDSARPLEISLQHHALNHRARESGFFWGSI